MKHPSCDKNHIGNAIRRLANTLTKPDNCRTLLLDFDGVIHSYTSGWAGATVIMDTPVPGAIEFIREAMEHFEVVIYSSRSADIGGIVAMQAWLSEYGITEAELDNLSFPTRKPAAWVTIDDRAIQFTGKWPTMAELKMFQPWYKRPEPQGLNLGPHAEELLEECRHPLGTNSLLATSPSYTSNVIRVAMEIAYSAGVKGCKLAEPKGLRVAVNAMAQSLVCEDGP